MAQQNSPEEMMKQERIVKEDGRYIIFYSFENKMQPPQRCENEELLLHNGHEKP